MFESLFTHHCTHDKVSQTIKAGYCPDCGEYVENHWYITRCECCGNKQHSLVRNGKIVTETKFCKNCGSNSFVVEEIEELDIVSIQYAVVRRQVREKKKEGIIKTWIEQNPFTPAGLLTGC